jgi:hypothetical protein
MSMISQLLAPVKPVPNIGTVYDQRFFDAKRMISNAEMTDWQLRKIKEQQRGKNYKTRADLNSERRKASFDMYIQSIRRGNHLAADIAKDVNRTANQAQAQLSTMFKYEMVVRHGTGKNGDPYVWMIA